MDNYIDDFQVSQDTHTHPSWFDSAPLLDEVPNDEDPWSAPSQDLDIGIPCSPHPVAPPYLPSSSSLKICPPELNQHSPPELKTSQTPADLPTTTLPATMSEYLANLFKWPRIDPNATIVTRPPTTSEQLKNWRDQIKKIELKEGQYASDVLTFHQIQNIAFEGGCGTGKSTLAMDHKHFIIFIAPTTVIVDQLASHDCQVIKAGVEPDFEKYQRFASTYDSLPKLTAAALAAGFNPYKIPIIVDECQHLLSDGFKSKQLDACMWELRKFDHVTMASATIPPYIPYFENLPKIIINPANRSEIQWSYVIGSDVAFIENSLRSGQTVLFHLNDKKMIDVVGEHIHGLGFKWEHIDADNKDEMMMLGLERKRLPEADLFMCTSVFNDGISVHEHADRYIIIISEQSARHIGPYEIYQITRRFRDNKPIHVYIMRKSNEFDDDVIFSEEMYKSFYSRLVARAEKQAARLNQEYQEEIKLLDEISKEFLINSQDILERLFPMRDNSFVTFNSESDIYEVNLRAIGEFVYAHLKSVCYSSRYMMQHWLSKYGLEFCEVHEAEKESELEKDLLNASKNLTNDDREEMRKHIASFETFNEVVDASKATPPLTYTQASELLPFDQFVKEREQEEQGSEKLREEYREALRGKVKEAVLEQKAAQVLREHFSTVYQANPGAKPDAVLAIAKRELEKSTLTGKALKHLKHGKLLQAIAKGVRNPKLTKILESAFITEVLKDVNEGIPLLESEINASFERGFAHSTRARKQFTVVPKAPKGEEPTDAQIDKAVRKQWKKRKLFLNYFFEMKSKRVTIDGKLSIAWTPTKALCKEMESFFAQAIIMSITIGKPLVESEINASFERNFKHSEQARKHFTVAPQNAPGCEPTDEEIAEAAQKQWKKRREFLDCFFKMKSKRIQKNGERTYVWTATRALF